MGSWTTEKIGEKYSKIRFIDQLVVFNKVSFLGFKAACYLCINEEKLVEGSVETVSFLKVKNHLKLKSWKKKKNHKVLGFEA